MATALAGSMLIYYGVILPARIVDNERAAFAALKTLVGAEADFRMNDRDGNLVHDFWTGDIAGLYGLQVKGKPIALIPRAIAEADAEPLVRLVDRPVPYHGYFFIAMDREDSDLGKDAFYRQVTDTKSGPVHNNSRFGFCAYPANYGRTGRVTFLVNEDNTIFKVDRKGQPVRSWPSD